MPLVEAATEGVSDVGERLRRAVVTYGSRQCAPEFGPRLSMITHRDDIVTLGSLIIRGSHGDRADSDRGHTEAAGRSRRGNSWSALVSP